MQSKTVKNDMILFPIPKDLLDEIGLDPMEVVQMSVADGKLIIEKAEDTDDFVCDGDCDSCPFGDTDCDEDCENCPCAEVCDENADCRVSESCDECPYCCPHCGECLCEETEDDEDE